MAKGKINGYGLFYYETGELMYKGSFRNNELHGEGTLYSETGNIKHDGEFRDGTKWN